MIATHMDVLWDATFRLKNSITVLSDKLSFRYMSVTPYPGLSEFRQPTSSIYQTPAYIQLLMSIEI